MTKHTKDLSNEVIKLIVDYINSDESTQISFSKYCNKYMLYHYDSLERRFKKDIGIGICEFIMAEKVRLVKRLIKEHPELNLKEISKLCRYKHQSHMTNHFKKSMNISPNQYKKMIQKGKTDQYEDF